MIIDPLAPDTAYAYLFESDGTLDPGAEDSTISYDFNLLSGDYKSTYNTESGPNPESSRVATPAYVVHFADRWIRDETAVIAGSATGVDILDRHRSLFAPGNCTRSEDTFSNGEGALIINREGPVRAIRGYIGANSGPTTYRVHCFYEEREDILTVLRVHAIGGILDFYDYSPAAYGMTYYDEFNTGGTAVDGVPDTVVPGEFTWMMVTGAQGTMVHSMLLNTDIPGFDYSSYYQDDSTPPHVQCTGDAYEYGASGFWEQDPIPNTDPGVSETYNIFEVMRVISYGPENQDPEFAQARAAEALNPLIAEASGYDPDPTASVDLEKPVAGQVISILEVGPNPAREAIGVHLTFSAPGFTTIDLHDVSGRRLRRLYAGSSAGGHFEADISDLAAGIYFVRARLGNEASRVGKVVVIR
jgi:hypothetical protein